MTENNAAEIIAQIIEDENLSTYLDHKALAAYADNLSHNLADLAGWLDEAEEAYNGEHGSDEDFAQTFAEEIGAVNENATWPNNYIDWERAAHDLMFDYFESDGYYFRNL